jgi:hypothetical protein
MAIKVTYSLVRTAWDTASSPDAQNQQVIVQELTFHLTNLAKLAKLAEKDQPVVLTKQQETAIRNFLAAVPD